MTWPKGAPDYGTAPAAELETPRSPAYLVYNPWARNGTTHVVGFGADQLDDARALASVVGGIVVRAAVVADYRRPVSQPGE